MAYFRLNLLVTGRLAFAILVLSWLIPTETLSAQEAQYRKAENPVIPLWENAEGHLKTSSMECFERDSLAADRGLSVIICPGGSYHWLGMIDEGLKVAQWLRSEGINAYVLTYRTAGIVAHVLHYRIFARGVQHPDMLQDLQRAIELVRLREGGSRKVGVMGFSAGGHLAVASALYAGTNFMEAMGLHPHVSLRPDFVAPVYPVVTMSHKDYTHRRSRRGLLGEYGQNRRVMRDSMSLEKHVTPDCCPVFLMNCLDDPVVDYQNSQLLCQALCEQGVSHRYECYATGGHGFGANPGRTSEEAACWMDAFIDWVDSLYPPMSPISFGVTICHE